MSKQLNEEVTMEGNSLRVIEAKTGHLIPQLESHSLHSTFDPIAEAVTEISTKSEQLIKANYILVLGLGFAYHVDEIRKLNEHASIWILEPNKELIQAYLKATDKPINAKIICEQDLNSLFMADHFTEFLLNKPVIICHKNSIEANGPYFRGFLKYQASKFCSDYINNLDESVRDYVESETKENEDLTLQALSNNKKQIHHLDNKNDFLILALDSLLETPL